MASMHNGRIHGKSAATQPKQLLNGIGGGAGGNSRVGGIKPIISIMSSSTNNAVTSTTTAATTAAHHHNVNGPMDNLPKQFVSAMRTLFDIMDDKRTGYVRLTDIERRWQDDGAKGLPHGVIDCLRKVTPSNGQLSFERFCAGLKICLLRNQSESGAATTSTAATTTAISISKKRIPPPPSSAIIISSTSAALKDLKTHRSSSIPLLDLPPKNSSLSTQWKANNTAAVRPNNAIISGGGVQRALSLPKLTMDSDDPDEGGGGGGGGAPPPPVPRSGLPIILPSLYAPPKPPRTALLLGNGVTNINHLDRLDKAEIRHALQNWQMGVMMNEDKRSTMAHLNRGTADGGSNDLIVGQQPQPPPTQKKSNSRRREPRRHTLQNGIDYNMLKKLKQFEQEKEVLLQGLSAVEKAHDWYVRQIGSVQEKIKDLGKMGSYMVRKRYVVKTSNGICRVMALILNIKLSN